MATCNDCKIIRILLISIIFFAGHTALAREVQGRLGLGMTNQLKNGLPAISIKVQSSKSSAFGALLGMSTSDTEGGYGVGLKMYRIFFDEPQLHFYGSFLGAMLKQKTLTQDSSGFQFDFTLGSEFSFAGLESLGFSFEFGVSLNKLTDFVAETVGDHFVTAGIHFYF